ncbi:glycosyltransferase family 2 protein [Cesiribacter sp. SM1]|uniref:glycosyltransferase family 2 protein n=1 Tax=Cesiribacter sp. SM1 TaxID=2861196 RepID=UPI001CD5E413|nr:glycosyltransferase [Cesiribacter sp. SM1]
MAFPPYHIHHLYLNQQQAMPSLSPAEEGHYLVFWWEELPLGHVFIEPGQKISEKEYYKKLAAAIAPAVEQYAKKRGMEAAAKRWSLALQKGDVAGSTALLSVILNPELLQGQPAEVPVSVIICTRNRASSLNHCLESLHRMAYRPQEIIVVDNAPADASTENIVKKHQGVIYCMEPTPGLSFARNTGIKKAKAPFIAFTDDDVSVHPHWVYRVWQGFEQTGAAAFTGLVIANELDTEAQLIFEKHWSFNRGYVDKLYNEQYFNDTLAIGPPVWEIGAGANAAFQKAIFEKIGYFDERLGAGASGCSEDSELWYRILAKGYSICYTPRAVVYHGHRNSLEALHRQLFSYMKGFTAAALIQQEQYPQARYKKHLFRALPKYYFFLILRGFPNYRFRHKTLWSEIRGVCSGLLFYLKNRRKPSFSKNTAQ